MKPIPLRKALPFVLLIFASALAGCVAPPAPRPPPHTMQDFAVDEETVPKKSSPRVESPAPPRHDPGSRAYHLERRLP